jgi:hypothetical protein
MRLAIFSDVHGNPFACEAVLGAIAREGTFDTILAAGDLCLGGSDPAGCIERLAAAGVQAVCGNTEQYLRFPDQLPRMNCTALFGISSSQRPIGRLPGFLPNSLAGFSGCPLSGGSRPPANPATICCWCMPTPKT